MAEDPKDVAMPTVQGTVLPSDAPAMPTAASGPPSMPGVLHTARGPIPPSSAPAMPTLRGPVDPSAGQSIPSMATRVSGAHGQDGVPDLPPPDFGAPPEIPHARYEIGLEIARGGMGRVVEAADTVLGRTVALKEALALDQDSLARFAREIRITARLEHPSIVPVHDAGSSTGGAPFYVMRKVEGKPLEKLVAETSSLSERLALIPHIVASANAIAHAHERGIVHRDIKPSNILVGDLGETIVIDWGLAKVIGETEERAVGVLPPRPIADDGDTIKTRAGIVYGTPGFMAPEQLRGAPADERCDVYALGATLYHLLARKPPHHAKTADEMMRAAVDGQAKSLVELVEGVPPDLSTIVDKSLAHDAKDRYQHARALAADLERFLKGQLIAAHHYTRGDRLKRFVRTHRVPILGIGVATAAALAVGIVSIVNVIHERDRADAASVEARHEQHVAEQARAEAEDRADALTLANARSLLETNPTLAVAMIKRLAPTRRWQDVRAIAAGARFAGVAWRAEASTATTSVQLAHDGHRALTAGNDGAIRMYDLAKHTVAKLADLHAPMTVRFADGDKRIVLHGGTRLVTMDAAGGDRHEITVPAPIRDLEVAGTTLYFIDQASNLFELELGAATPLQVPLDEGVSELAISPDGRWIALKGTLHLLLLDRTVPSSPPREAYFGRTRDMGWSANSTHLVAQVDGSVVDLDVTLVPEPRIVRKMLVGERYSATVANGQLYSLGPLGISVASSRDNLEPRKQFPAQALGIHLGRNGTVLAASTNAIHALSEDGDHVLLAPVPQLESLAASPDSAYVVATSEGSLLAWDLDAIQGTRIAAGATGARFTGTDRLIATFSGEPAGWIEIATKAATPLDASGALRQVAGSPDGRRAILVDVSHRAQLVGLGQPPQALAGQIDLAKFIDDERALLASPGPDGGTQLELLEITAKRRTVLVQRAAKLLSMSWNHASPPSVAASFDDGVLWRAELTSAKAGTLELGKRLASPIQIADDGTVWFAVDTELRAWREGGAERVATVPKAIVNLGILTERAVAFTDDGSSYVVELGHVDQIAPLFPLNKRAAMAAQTGLIITTRGAFLDGIDPLVHARWTIASANNATFDQPEVSRDGARVLALLDGKVIVWNLDLPATPAATAAWLDTMTNAYDKGTSELGWR